MDRVAERGLGQGESRGSGGGLYCTEVTSETLGDQMACVYSTVPFSRERERDCVQQAKAGGGLMESNGRRGRTVQDLGQL